MDFNNELKTAEEPLLTNENDTQNVKNDFKHLAQQSNDESNNGCMKQLQSASLTQQHTSSKRKRVFRRIRRHVRKRFGGKESALLALYTLGLLVSSCWNSIFFKKMTNAMPNYGWFLSQVTCFSYVPLFGAVILYSIRKGDITKEMRQFPMYKFGVMGLLDCLLCLMGIVGGAFTSGPTQLVLSQAVIPVTLVLSSLILNHRYHMLQHFGAIVIIIGVLITKITAFYPSQNIAGHGKTIQDAPIFNIIYGCSALPNALSQIYKEVAFRDGNLDVNYMQFWVSVFQLIGGIFIAPLNALPFLGTQQIPLAKMGQMILAGLKCLFLGTNSITEHCGGSDEPICDACSLAWVSVAGYLCFNILYNIFTLLVVKHGGASLSFVVATLRLPLTTVCFYSSTIMGKDATSPAPEDFIGLLVLLIGLIAYRYGGVWRDMQDDGVPLSCAVVEEDNLKMLDARGQKFSKDLYEDEEDELASDTEEVAVVSLMVEPGPIIFKVHRQLAKTIYLKPLEPNDSILFEVGSNCSSGYCPPGYMPPPLKFFRCSSPNQNHSALLNRPPRRRTMHDFRDVQIQKITSRRLPSPVISPALVGETSPVTSRHMCYSYQPWNANNKDSGEDEKVCGDTSSEDGLGYISEGSVNSLMAASRPAPMEVLNSKEKDDNELLYEPNENNGVKDTNECKSIKSTPRQSDASNRASSVGLSLMLSGGLDVNLLSSPKMGPRRASADQLLRCLAREAYHQSPRGNNTENFKCSV